MLTNESHGWERRETLEELMDVTRLAEKVAQRLVCETHGKSYDDSVELCELLRKARARAEFLKCVDDIIEQRCAACVAPPLWPLDFIPPELPVT